jgi:hypothetical protein
MQSKHARNRYGSVRGRVRFGISPFTLYFLDLYLSSEDESRFRPPPPFRLSEVEPEVVPERAYRKDELLSYVDHGRKKLDAVMAGVTESLGCGTVSLLVSRDEQW